MISRLNVAGKCIHIIIHMHIVSMLLANQRLTVESLSQHSSQAYNRQAARDRLRSS